MENMNVGYKDIMSMGYLDFQEILKTKSEIEDRKLKMLEEQNRKQAELTEKLREKRKTDEHRLRHSSNSSINKKRR